MEEFRFLMKIKISSVDRVWMLICPEKKIKISTREINKKKARCSSTDSQTSVHKNKIPLTPSEHRSGAFIEYPIQIKQYGAYINQALCYRQRKLFPFLINTFPRWKEFRLARVEKYIFRHPPSAFRYTFSKHLDIRN